MRPEAAQKLLSNAVIAHAAGMAACGVNTKHLILTCPTPWSVEMHMNEQPLYRVTLMMTSDTVCLKEEVLVDVKPIPGFEMWFPPT